MARNKYRYGFNGKENDNEVGKGEGGQQDYGFRIYDPRIAKFLSVDPITMQYPELTPYQFASNTPIQAIDLDGLEQWMQQQEHAMKRQAEMKMANAELVAKQAAELYVAAADIYGRGHIGKLSVVREKLAYIKEQHFIAVGEAIASGPFAAAGYIIDGDRGAFLGAAVDNIAMSFGGIGEKNSRAFPKEATIETAKLSTYIEGGVPERMQVNRMKTARMTWLKSRFNNLATEKLLPKYLAEDPNLKAGYTGSFNTGKVGNKTKSTYGQDIDLSKFDIDFWIESDILYKKYGKKIIGYAEFREVLKSTPGFEGLKPDKQGFSIKFIPKNKDK